MRLAELGRVAPENARDAAEAQRRDVLAQQRARLGAVVDEQRKRRAARQRLDPERAGAGEQVEHARAGDRIAIGVHEDVEQRLAQAVGGRTDRVRFRRGERAPAQPSADDAHQRFLPGDGRRPRSLLAARQFRPAEAFGVARATLLRSIASAAAASIGHPLQVAARCLHGASG